MVPTSWISERNLESNFVEIRSLSLRDGVLDVVISVLADVYVQVPSASETGKEFTCTGTVAPFPKLAEAWCRSGTLEAVARF